MRPHSTHAVVAGGVECMQPLVEVSIVRQSNSSHGRSALTHNHILNACVFFCVVPLRPWCRDLVSAGPGPGPTVGLSMLMMLLMLMLMLMMLWRVSRKGEAMSFLELRDACGCRCQDGRRRRGRCHPSVIGGVMGDGARNLHGLQLQSKFC